MVAPARGADSGYGTPVESEPDGLSGRFSRFVGDDAAGRYTVVREPASSFRKRQEAPRRAIRDDGLRFRLAIVRAGLTR